MRITIRTTPENFKTYDNLDAIEINFNVPIIKLYDDSLSNPIVFHYDEKSKPLEAQISST